MVDDKKQTELKKAYQELLQRRRASQKPGELFKSGILNEVFNLTTELIHFNEDVVARLTKGLKPDQKISLSCFIKNRGGVCRHQALLAAYLLEKLKSEGYINGSVSIDRNYLPGQGGHAWVRYVNSQGKIFILDPAQNFIGRIEDAQANGWIYERPK